VLVFVKMKHGILIPSKIIEVPTLKNNENVQDVFTLSGSYAFGVFWW